MCSSQSPALQQLTSLYVCRSKSIWRDTAILPWLERNVNTVLDRVDAKDSIVAEYTLKRSQRYNKTPPKEILRHIILSDFKEKVPLAPFINKDTEPILMYDPLPPTDTINIYTRCAVCCLCQTVVRCSNVRFFFSLLDQICHHGYCRAVLHFRCSFNRCCQTLTYKSLLLLRR